MDRYRHSKLDALAHAIANQEIRKLVWNIAEDMRTEEDPELSASDMAASQAYLRRCFLNRTPAEIGALSFVDIAGLWARGCLGCARHRARDSGGRDGARAERGGKGRKPRRGRRRDADVSGEE